MHLLVPDDVLIGVVNVADGHYNLGGNHIFFSDKIDENVCQVRIMSFVHFGKRERRSRIGVMFLAEIRGPGLHAVSVAGARGGHDVSVHRNAREELYLWDICILNIYSFM